MGVRFDESNFPIVEIVFKEPIEMADVEQFGAKSRELLARRVRHVPVFDGRGLIRLAADRRRRLAQIADELGAESKQWVICSCLVLTNPVMRGIVTAINWLSPPPVEQQMFSDRQAAMDYAKHRIALDAKPAPSPQ
jgi:hypothetical protein